MRGVVLPLLVALAVGGCGGGGDNEDDAPPSAPTSTTAGPDPADAEADAGARAAVEAFYDLVGPHDCVSMRVLSSADQQREDDAWNACIDLLLEVAPADYSYEITGGGAEGDTASYEVRSTATDEAGGEVTRTDPIELVRAGDVWLVDASFVTAAG